MLCECMCDGVQGSQSDAVPWAIQVTWLLVHQEVHLLFVNVGVQPLEVDQKLHGLKCLTWFS
jgi:hypothetical protein